MKITESKLRQIIREELLNEIDTDNLDMYLDALNPFASIKTATEYYAGLAGEASVDPQAAKKRFARDSAESGAQDVLGVLEYIPIVGAGAGVVNAGMYALQGNDQRALFSLAAGLMAGVSGAGIAKALKTGSGQKFVANLDLLYKTFKGKLMSEPFAIGMKPSLDAVEKLLVRGALALTPVLAGAEDALAEDIEDVKKENEALRSMAKKAVEKKRAFENMMAEYEGGVSDPDFGPGTVDPESIEEAVIRRLLNEQPYKTPGQEYIALFLDDASRDKLTDTLDDPPPGWTLYADHMTVKFGSEGVPERYLGPAQCKVVGVALNDRVMAARVETDIPTQNDIPHITIATAPGAKPRESNDFSLDDFDDVDAIVLKGEVRPEFREELQKKRPGI